VDELVLPGDIEAGDVIELPDDARRFRVMMVRLGHGGFILRVAPAEGPGPRAEREITLTAATRLRRHGRVRAF
jgi:hypothetical protein